MSIASKSGAGPNRPKAVRRGAGLTREQLALIHVARRDRDLAEDEYRALLLRAAGVASAKELSATGFRKVMDGFKAIGFVHQSAVGSAAPAAQKVPSFGARGGMATEAQIDLIRQLWARWHGTQGELAMNHWIEGRFRVSNIRFANVEVAQMAIEGLKAMTSRKTTKSNSSNDGVKS